MSTSNEGRFFIESVVTNGLSDAFVFHGQNTGFLVLNEVNDVRFGSTTFTIELDALVFRVAGGFSEVGVLAPLDGGFFTFALDAVDPGGFVDTCFIDLI